MLWLLSTQWPILLLFQISGCISFYCIDLSVHLTHARVCYNQYHENKSSYIGEGSVLMYTHRIHAHVKMERMTRAVYVAMKTLHESSWDNNKRMSLLYLAHRIALSFLIVTCVYAFQSTKCGWKQTWKQRRIRKRENTTNTNTFSFVLFCCCIHLTHKFQAFLHVN